MENTGRDRRGGYRQRLEGLLCGLGLHHWARSVGTDLGPDWAEDRCTWCDRRRVRPAREHEVDAWYIARLRDSRCGLAGAGAEWEDAGVGAAWPEPERAAALHVVRAWRAQPAEAESRTRQFRARALGAGVRARVAELRGRLRPDEVAAVVMEEGIGRAGPLTPRRWAVPGFGAGYGACNEEEAEH